MSELTSQFVAAMTNKAAWDSVNMQHLAPKRVDRRRVLEMLRIDVAALSSGTVETPTPVQKLILDQASESEEKVRALLDAIFAQQVDQQELRDALGVIVGELVGRITALELRMTLMELAFDGVGHGSRG